MKDAFSDLIAARRHVGLRKLLAPGPDDAALRDIVAAAAHAPDHGQLQPWRFILVPAGSREALAEVFALAVVERQPDADEAARQAARQAARDKAFHAACLLVAVLVDDPASATVSAAEKLVSLGAAIQNMLLAAHALGFASGLATGGALDTPPMRNLLRLRAHERAVCFIGFGTAAAPKSPRPQRQLDTYFSRL